MPSYELFRRSDIPTSQPLASFPSTEDFSSGFSGGGPSSSYLSSYISQLVRAEPYPGARCSHLQHQNMIGIDNIREFAARNIPGGLTCMTRNNDGTVSWAGCVLEPIISGYWRNAYKHMNNH